MSAPAPARSSPPGPAVSSALARRTPRPRGAYDGRARYLEALASGQHQLACFRYLIWSWGRSPTKWAGHRTAADFAAAMVQDLERFTHQHRLDPCWCAPDGRPIRMAARFALDWKLHKAHFRLGTPLGWEKDRARWFVGLDAAEAAIAAFRGQQSSSQAKRTHQIRRALVGKRSKALAYRMEGMTNRQIAAKMGVSIRTIQYWLTPG